MSTNNNQQKEYLEYIANKHAQMTTPQEKLNEIVLKATEKSTASTHRLLLGESNEVYDITLENAEHVIVRVSHEEGSTFKKEEWVFKQCKEAGVPVAKMYLVEDFEIDDHFRSICVLEKLKGEPLMARIREERLSEDEHKLILTNAGSILSKIHSIETKKFGRIDANGVGKYNTWKENIVRRGEDSERFKEVARKINIDEAMIDKAIEILKKHEDIYDTVTPHLLHGDFGYEHIFVDGTTITGIIDFEDARSGDAVWDFAWWDFFHEDKEKIEWLKEGYENKLLFENEFNLRLHLYKLCLSLDFLDYYDGGNFDKGLQIAKRNLEESLKFFEL